MQTPVFNKSQGRFSEAPSQRRLRRAGAVPGSWLGKGWAEGLGEEGPPGRAVRLGTTMRTVTPRAAQRPPRAGSLTSLQRSWLVLSDETVAKYHLAPGADVDFHKFVYMRLQETSGCFFPPFRVSHHTAVKLEVNINILQHGSPGVKPFLGSLIPRGSPCPWCLGHFQNLPTWGSDHLPFVSGS